MNDCATFGHPNIAGGCACGQRRYEPRPAPRPGPPELLVVLDELVGLVAGVAVDHDRDVLDAGRS